jgi:hypothetical protein
MVVKNYYICDYMKLFYEKLINSIINYAISKYMGGGCQVCSKGGRGVNPLMQNTSISCRISSF